MKEIAPGAVSHPPGLGQQYKSAGNLHAQVGQGNQVLA